MDEEAMWKGFYDKLQEIKENPVTEHEAQYVIIFFHLLFKFYKSPVMS